MPTKTGISVSHPPASWNFFSRESHNLDFSFKIWSFCLGEDHLLHVTPPARRRPSTQITSHCGLFFLDIGTVLLWEAMFDPQWFCSSSNPMCWTDSSGFPRNCERDWLLRICASTTTNKCVGLHYTFSSFWLVSISLKMAKSASFFFELINFCCLFGGFFYLFCVHIIRRR